MDNKLTLRGEFMPPRALEQIKELTKDLVDSKALPATITNGAQLMMVLLAGFEAGMTPMESINGYYIVNGRVTIWGSAVLTQLKRAKYGLRWVESNDKTCTVEITTPDGKDKHTETFTFEEAVKAGLTGKDPWKKYPRNMLRWKALGNGVRFFCPEVLGGYYIKEEVDDDNGADVSIVQTVTERRRGRNAKTVNAEVVADEPKAPVEKTEQRLAAEERVRKIWTKMGEAKQWTLEVSMATFKKTLVTYYKTEDYEAMTDEQVEQLATRLENAYGDKPEEPAANAPTAEDIAKDFGGKVVEKCPACSKEYEDDGKTTGNAAAVRNAGACNDCLQKEETQQTK